MKSVISTLYSLSALSAVSFAAPAVLPLGYGSDNSNSNSNTIDLTLNGVESQLTGSGSELLGHLKSASASVSSALQNVGSNDDASALAQLKSTEASIEASAKKGASLLQSAGSKLQPQLMSQLKSAAQTLETDAHNVAAELNLGSVSQLSSAEQAFESALSGVSSELNLGSISSDVTALGSAGSDFESQLNSITSKLSGSSNPLSGLTSIVSSGINPKDQSAITAYAQQLMQTLTGELKGHTDALSSIADLVHGNVTDAEKALAKEAANKEIGTITSMLGQAQVLCSGTGSSPTATNSSTNNNNTGSPSSTDAPFPQDCYNTVTGKNGAVNNGQYPVATMIANFLKDFSTSESNLESAFGLDSFVQELRPFDDALDTLLITVGCMVDGLLHSLGKSLVDGSAGLQSFVQHNSLAQSLIKSVKAGSL